MRTDRLVGGNTIAIEVGRTVDIILYGVSKVMWNTKHARLFGLEGRYIFASVQLLFYPLHKNYCL